jgi:hypothetical protein
MVPLPHVVVGSGDVLVSYGLRLSGAGIPNIFLTLDTMFDLDYPEYLLPHYEWADVIFHDCEPAETASNVHPYYGYLKEDLPYEIRKKTYLVHYDDLVLEPDGSLREIWKFQARADNFLGFVPKGFVFNASEAKEKT